MNMNKMPQDTKELDRLIAEQVMGLIPCDEWFTESRQLVSDCVHECYPRGSADNYSGNMAIAWSVHQVACGWIYSKRQRYLVLLQDCARTDDDLLIAWPDVMVALKDSMALAICTAALMTVRECSISAFR